MNQEYVQAVRVQVLGLHMRGEEVSEPGVREPAGIIWCDERHSGRIAVQPGRLLSYHRRSV